MPSVKGIGFDLFGTLVLQERFSFEQCLDNLYHSLLSSGFSFAQERFVEVYRQVNRRFMDQAAADGRETHNCAWVAGALQALEYAVAPEDPRVQQAVERYFDPFINCCQLIPGTREMLTNVAGRYRLALVSNFTHLPWSKSLPVWGLDNFSMRFSSPGGWGSANLILPCSLS